MSEWKEYELQEVVSIIKDVYTPAKGDNKRYIGLEHIQQHSLRLDSIGTSESVTSQKFSFRSSDILFGKLRPYFRKVVNPDFDGVCSTDIWVIRAKENHNQKFVRYLVSTYEFIETCNIGESGTRMPRADWNHLKGTKWLLPEYDEQERIAEVLSSLDDKIDLLHKQNQTLEQLAETLFRHLFLDVTKDSEDISLIDLASHIKDGVNPYKSPETIFYHYSIPAFDNGRQPEKEYGKSILSNKYVVSSGDILISKLNPRTPRIWHVGEAEKSSICSTEFQVYKPKEKEYSEFVYCMLSSTETRDILAAASSGTSGSHQRVTPDVINQLSIKRPDENSLRVFHQQAKEWFLKVSSNVKHIQLLQQTRDTLLPKLMSGTVRVNN